MRISNMSEDVRPLTGPGFVGPLGVAVGCKSPPVSPAEAAVVAVTELPTIDVIAPWKKMGSEILAGVQTVVSPAVYATLIVTFGFQVARVDGLSTAPTLEDHDRLIVNKLVYELGDPRPGDIVILYYPLNPAKMLVKRVIAHDGAP